MSTSLESDKQTRDDEYVEEAICTTSDIAENEMKVFEIKNTGRVLLIRQKGKFHALGSECTHYGAPLVNSALGDGRIRCQWHGACFNINTGDIEDFPGMDSLPCHQVTIENETVRVKAKISSLKSGRRVKPMSKRIDTDPRQFVVIGGGPAGAVCVETLRQENFSGKIIMICKENYLPYNRVKVSKVIDFDIKANQLRTMEFYQENHINVLLGVAADKLNTTSREIQLENGDNIRYDKLFIATGSQPALLNIPGKDLKNVFTLRNVDDGKNLTSEFGPHKRVVIVGSSFISMEVASSCIDKVKTVSIISYTNVPFKEALGEKIGHAFMELCAHKGVVFRPNVTLMKINDNGTGKVVNVELTDGTTLETDIVLLGVGSRFSTDFLKSSSIALRSDGSIEVDRYLKSNVHDVFVGGDIAYAPVYPYENRKANIGHFALAQYHGKVAALNMLDITFELRCIPYFWTSLFGQSIRYAGNGNFDDIVYVGNVDHLKFVAFYINEMGEVVAACSCGMDPYVSKFAELLHQRKKLYRKDLDESMLGCLVNSTPD